MKTMITKTILVSVTMILVLTGVATQAQTPTRSNGKIAFTSNRDGNREIYIMNSDGTDQVRLTNNSAVDDFAVWSPDGKRLACLSQDLSGGYFIKLMNVDGTGQTVLAQVVFDGQFDPFYSPRWRMSWSPDASKIAFPSGHEIFVITVDGRNLINLTNSAAFDSHPSWSPDGLKILFSSNPAGQYAFRFFSMNADGAGQVEMPFGDLGQYVGDLDPSWSPDGTKVAGVQSWMLEGKYLFIWDTSGNSGFMDFYLEGYPSSPSWSPDGTKIVYSSSIVGVYPQAEIFSRNSDGSELRRLTSTGGYEAHPTWQPIITAAELGVSISGRVTTPEGRGLRNATVTLTDSTGVGRNTTTSSLGFYTFEDVRPEGTILLGIISKRYRFTPRSMALSGNITNVDFVGLE